jgi:PAS domain S-box-containing protein
MGDRTIPLRPDPSSRTDAQHSAGGDHSGREFRLLFANNPLPMWIYDRETFHFIEVNDAAVAKYGYSREEFLAMRITDIRPAEDISKVIETAGRLTGPFRNSGQWRHKLRDGRLIEVEINSHDIDFEGAVATLVVVHDITDRRMAEQARSSMERIFETSQDLILVVDRKGTFMQVSPSSEEILGYRPEELVGHNAIEFLYPDDLESTRDHMRQAQRGGLKSHFETRYVHKGGRIVTLTWTGAWSEPEQRHFFIGRDMTGRRRAEDEIRRLNEELEERVHQRTAELMAANDRLAALHANEERFRLMVESVRDYAIYTLDPVGNLASWNAGAERLKGYSAAEIIGRHFSTFYTEEDRRREHPQYELERAMAEGRYEEEGWRVRKDGSRFWAAVTITAVRAANGALLGFAKVTRDMSEKQEAEKAIHGLNDELRRRVAELDASNQELEAFSYSVSHDLRAPLRAIDGFSRILQDDYAEQLPDDGKRFVQVVRKNAQQMGRLIDDLLAFSRLGRQAPKTEPVPLSELADQIIAELQPDCAGRTVEFAIGELGIVQADPALLKQALANLLSNALKFTRKKDVAQVEVGRREDPERGTAYFVRDNGAGFDMRYADKLFSVFQRLHRPEDYEGTGVGLAIVQRVIHRHGGQVWADAKVGEGATFYFTLREVSRQ